MKRIHLFDSTFQQTRRFKEYHINFQRGFLYFFLDFSIYLTIRQFDCFDNIGMLVNGRSDCLDFFRFTASSKKLVKKESKQKFLSPEINR